MKVFDFLVKKISNKKILLGEALAQFTGLDQNELKDAAFKGAVCLQRNAQGKIHKSRDVNLMVSPADKIIFYYEPKILALPGISKADCLFESKQYGIWIKAAGVLAQGTQASDHTSLLRYVEQKKGKEVFLVHRLDRETEGLMVIAYHSQAAGILSDMFQKNFVKKIYHTVVKGELQVGLIQVIEKKLDGKSAQTLFEVLSSEQGKSLLKVEIKTGRLHQIRRHLESIGYPVMGDPQYGKGNKNKDGLMLLAKSLEFFDPWSQEQVLIVHPGSLKL